MQKNEGLRRIISLGTSPATLQGREIFTTDGRKTSLNLSGAPEGIYILKIEAE